jgi:3-oxoacyl-[acyl-carrier protein] reductase
MRNPTLTDGGLSNGVAIVTGGSRGIGRAIVEVLAAAEMQVVFTYRDNAAAAAEVIAGAGKAQVTAHNVDVRDSTACAALIERTFDRTGRIDLLVNNAGITRDNILGDMSDDDLAAVLDTNVTGTFNMTRAIVPYMISQRRGKIVNISSVSAEKGGRGQSNYAASKGAIDAFTRALAAELGPRNIAVNAVAPGIIETEMSRAVRERAGDSVTSRILMRRIGRPEEVAYAVWFLASKYADYITGQILRVDGGFKVE